MLGVGEEEVTAMAAATGTEEEEAGLGLVVLEASIRSQIIAMTGTVLQREQIIVSLLKTFQAVSVGRTSRIT